MSHQQLDIQTPNDLSGALTAAVYEGDEPTNFVIRSDKTWAIEVKWWLRGALRECLGGTWCLQVYAESIGPGRELVLPGAEEVKIPLDPCGDGHYGYRFVFRPGTIQPQHCSIPYKLVVGLTYRTPCDEPGPMAGFIELPTVQFFESDK